MSVARPRRQPLGVARHALGLSYEVFIADEWIEVDEVEGDRIRRFRIPYDEVRLVTQCRHRPWGLGVALLFLGSLPLVIGLGILFSPSEGAAISAGILFAIALAFIVPTCAWLARGVRVVSIFGDRTKGYIRFNWNHDRARIAHDEVTARARRARRDVEAKLEAERAAVADAFLPPEVGNDAGASGMPPA